MNTYMHHHPRTIRCTFSAGFSLIELMVGLVISLFLLGGVIQIYLTNKQSYNAQDALARMQENGRFAMDVIARDLRRAGYLGGNAEFRDSYDGTIKILGTAGIATPASITCPSGDTTWGRMLEMRIVGLNDTNAGYACIPNSDYLQGDIVTIRYASPNTVSSATMDASPNRLYIRSSMSYGKLFTGGNQADTSNSNTDKTPQTAHELNAHAYYIGTSDNACPTDGSAVPALYRIMLNDSGQPEAELLADGIEDLQVQYGIDPGNDGAVDSYVNADEVDDWTEVTAARIWLLTRAACPETGFTNSQTYTLGGNEFTPGDNYRRQLYSSTLMLRNRRLGI